MTINAMTESNDFLVLQVAMDLRDATLRAKFNYRNQAVESLLTRIEDCMRLVSEKDYDKAEALRMIEAQCKRIRVIDEAMKS